MKIGVSSYSFQQLISSGAETQLSIIKKAKDMGTYNAQNLRAVYYWAKINGYDNIWQPKKISEV